jgi:hypothetical protein
MLSSDSGFSGSRSDRECFGSGQGRNGLRRTSHREHRIRHTQRKRVPIQRAIWASNSLFACMFRAIYMEFCEKGVYARYRGVNIDQGHAEQELWAHVTALSFGASFHIGKRNSRLPPFLPLLLHMVVWQFRCIHNCLRIKYFGECMT